MDAAASRGSPDVDVVDAHMDVLGAGRGGATIGGIRSTSALDDGSRRCSTTGGTNWLRPSGPADNFSWSGQPSPRRASHNPSDVGSSPTRPIPGTAGGIDVSRPRDVSRKRLFRRRSCSRTGDWVVGWPPRRPRGSVMAGTASGRPAGARRTPSREVRHEAARTLSAREEEWLRHMHDGADPGEHVAVVHARAAREAAGATASDADAHHVGRHPHHCADSADAAAVDLRGEVSAGGAAQRVEHRPDRR